MENENSKNLRAMQFDIEYTARKRHVTRTTGSLSLSLDRLKTKRVPEYMDYVFDELLKNADALYEMARENLDVIEEAIRFKFGSLDNDFVEASKRGAEMKTVVYNQSNQRFNEILNYALNGYSFKFGKELESKQPIWTIQQMEDIFAYLRERQKVQNDEMGERCIYAQCLSQVVKKKCREYINFDDTEFWRLYAQCIFDKNILSSERAKLYALQKKYKDDLEYEAMLDEKNPGRHCYGGWD